MCNDPATTEIYTRSLHDALPIYIKDPSPMIAEIRRVLKPGGQAILMLYYRNS